MLALGPAQQTTIFALSSGRGKAGVAVVRVSGPSAGLVLDRMAPPRPKPRRAAFRRIVDPHSGELLDAALVLFFEGPRSETGEDMAELQLHGSPAVVRRVLHALGTVPGCRLAEPGEFARRAFLNGKIDLTAAEGLADLIDAETDAQRRQALAHASGGFARLCDGWRGRLLEARALAEAAIDFSDEPDVAADSMLRARDMARALCGDIEGNLANAHSGEIVRDGFRVVIAGPPNVGKSSLLNALARRDVAIVSPEPGTTRDVVEVHLDLAGYAVIVADTAGLRDAPGAVEQEGIRRTRDRARAAELVLWLVDATAPQWQPPAGLASGAEQLLTVVNKADCIAGTARPAPPAVHVVQSGASATPIWVSALTGAGLPDLVARLSSLVSARLEDAAAGLLPTQARHRAALSACAQALSRLRATPNLAPELAAEELRHAADALGRITGRIDAEEVLGAIFGRFCIGK
jgi:tRNA modification GTPase